MPRVLQLRVGALKRTHNADGTCSRAAFDPGPRHRRRLSRTLGSPMSDELLRAYGGLCRNPTPILRQATNSRRRGGAYALLVDAHISVTFAGGRWRVRGVRSSQAISKSVSQPCVEAICPRFTPAGPSALFFSRLERGPCCPDEASDLVAPEVIYNKVGVTVRDPNTPFVAQQLMRVCTPT